MSKADFLRILRDGLSGLPAPDIDEILADYSAYFDEAHASGRGGVIGIGALASIFKIAHDASISTMLLRALAGVGLIGASAGCGALLLVALNILVKKLGGYAQLHYRVLKPEPLGV
jgi:hypothetical protein